MSNKRKEIIIDGVKWWYLNTSHSYGEYGAYYKPQTSFYNEPSVEKTAKTFGFFGPKFTYYENDSVSIFNIGINIEDPRFTKEEIKEAIDKQLNILKRKEEIKNGEII